MSIHLKIFLLVDVVLCTRSLCVYMYMKLDNLLCVYMYMKLDNLLCVYMYMKLDYLLCVYMYMKLDNLLETTPSNSMEI